MPFLGLTDWIICTFFYDSNCCYPAAAAGWYNKAAIIAYDQLKELRKEEEVAEITWDILCSGNVSRFGPFAWIANINNEEAIVFYGLFDLIEVHQSILVHVPSDNLVAHAFPLHETAPEHCHIFIADLNKVIGRACRLQSRLRRGHDRFCPSLFTRSLEIVFSREFLVW